MSTVRKGKRELVKKSKALLKAHTREYNRIDREIQYIVTMHNLGEVNITEENIETEVAKISELPLDNMEKLLILSIIENGNKQ